MGVDAIFQKDDLVDIYGDISKEDVENASMYLAKNIPKEDMEKIKKLLKQNPCWQITHHHGLGTYIRNLLREGGYNWYSLDDKWADLLSKAIDKST